DWHAVLSVNFYGIVRCLRSFVPRMLGQQTAGHIINTASLAGFTTFSRMAPYAASKHALVALSEAVQLQLQECGSSIGVSVLAPGPTRTAMYQRVARNPGSTEHLLSVEPEGDIERSAIPPAWSIGVMDPAETAKIAADAVRRGQFYIFPNAESRER